MVPRMKDLVIDSFLSVRRSINANRRQKCFEVFGFDFLIDEDFRTWLIEINTNPYLGTPSPDLEIIVPQMINDVLKLTVDTHFPPS